MTTAPPQPLTIWRCRSCGRIICRADLPPGALVEVKCKCHTVNTITVAAAAQTRV